MKKLSVVSIFLFFGFGATVPAQAVQVTISIVDQSNNAWTEGQVRIFGIGTFAQGSSADIPEGTYQADVSPFGAAFNFPITRTESNIQVSSTTTELKFEWISASGTLTVVDQSSQAWSGAQVNCNSLWFYHGDPFRLPITDTSVYPALSGPAADGYDCRVSVLGGQFNHPLERADNNIQVLASTTQLKFEWIAASGTIQVVDQLGQAWTGATLNCNSMGFYNGDTFRLPITDASVYPTLGGPAGDGYDCKLSVLGANFGHPLQREDNNIQVLASTTQLKFEWIAASGPISIVDSNENFIPSSSVSIQAIGTFNSCDNVRIPITDEAVYPTLFAQFATGFPITLYPGSLPGQSGSGTFEVFANNTFSPAFISISGQNFGLRILSVCPPAAPSPVQETQNLLNTVQSLGLPDGISNSLVSQLEQVVASLNAGNVQAAEGQLGAFINHVESQSGKKIDPAQAQQLIQAAQNILNQI